MFLINYSFLSPGFLPARLNYTSKNSFFPGTYAHFNIACRRGREKTMLSGYQFTTDKLKQLDANKFIVTKLKDCISCIKD